MPQWCYSITLLVIVIDGNTAKYRETLVEGSVPNCGWKHHSGSTENAEVGEESDA